MQKKIRDIDLGLKNICEKYNIPGISVCLTDANRAEWKNVYGVRSVETGEPLQVDDQFRAGSITKTLIAVIIMQLKEEGKLSINQTINAILDGVLQQESSLTIKHLLNHTSGLEDYLWVENEGQPMISKFDTAPEIQFSPDFLVKEALLAAGRFAPGEGFYYSNTNYILLGLIIEKITGATISEIINKRILEPLLMKQTYFPKTFYINTSYANGHSKFTQDFQPSDQIVYEYKDLNISLAWTAGALVSTPADLNRFMIGLFNNKIISEESLEEMMTFKETGDNGQSYGLGLYQFKDQQKTAIGHPGGISGYETVMLHYPDDDIYMTVMINQMPAGATSIAAELYDSFKVLE
ncbi:beta-lactamase family protein [Virgibacillus halodenitrificans]|uniref:serine hydrolase domain-containing protein n=1 Tax=Virgibacillus halodenitrificans TaxID=1482 RepID=UPI001F1F5191|nr:beta-lactamase family protein [Virgibacillus halodenitrificans]